jgi:glutamine---fructose-6-phosphate transaminase (isomerizing)
LNSNVRVLIVTTPTASSPSPPAPGYVADIRAQPQALQQLLDSPIDPAALKLLGAPERFGRVVLTGMGASLHAQYPAFLTLAAAGLPVWHVETAELLGEAAGLLTADTLLWVTSQSGRSAEITALLDRLPGRRPAVFAFTNDTASPLAGSADAVIELHSGQEHAVGTRSYVNSLAAHLRAVTAALGRQTPADVKETPARLADYLAGWDEHLATWDAAVSQQILFAVGRGASPAAARTGGLIVKEAAKTPLEAMSAAQFRHGPLEMADGRLCVIVLQGAPSDAPLNRRLADDLSSFGANAIVLGSPGDASAPRLPAVHSDEARPLAEILPFQLLSVVLAERLGLEPGTFHQIAKVTTTL